MGRREQGESRALPCVRKLPSPPHPSPAPCSSYWRAVLFSGALALFLLDHLSVTDQKTLGIKNVCQDEHVVPGETPHQHPALSLLPPSPLLLLLLLLLLYNIRLHYCTSTAMKPLHLISSPKPFGRCIAARHEWRGERLTDERNYKIKALLFVPETWRCGHSSAIKWQYCSYPFPLYILIYGVPVGVPCMLFFCLFVFFAWFRSSAVPVIIKCGGQESWRKVFFKTMNLFPSIIEIRECLFKVFILHRDEFWVELMRICQHSWTYQTKSVGAAGGVQLLTRWNKSCIHLSWNFRWYLSVIIIKRLARSI